ncbi:UvrD-helicase domain-containing protein [bacterium]|nr:UvrD-helicase domain-containing protein [bacterium]
MQYHLNPIPLKPPGSIKFNIDYSGHLNPQQFDVVATVEGPVLCIAGAGSGKTRALIYRVARLVESGIPPATILLLTFTRKAATEMLTRASGLLGGKCSNVMGGTYHSFAHIALRQFGSFLKLPSSFSILDEADSCDTINLIRNEFGFNKHESRFPMKKTLRKMFSKSINFDRALEEIVSEDFEHFGEVFDDIRKVFNGYSHYKIINNLLDFDDLLVCLKRLLEEIPEVREKLSERFRFVMVDEYQDTNKVQAKITALLGGNHQNILVVGDDAQSIYSFRGAYFKNLHDFAETFRNCRVIRLEENYRSTQPILNATNALIAHAKERFTKTLVTSKIGGGKPVFVACADEMEQSRFVSQRILELNEDGIGLNRIAVLFRSGFHAYQLELELKLKNVPFEKWGGFKFLEAAHIKDLLAHLRVLANPFEFISWQRVLLLVEGVGIKSVFSLFEKIKTARNPYEIGNISSSRRSQKGLFSLGNMLTSVSRQKILSPQMVLSKAADYYIPILKETFDDYPRRIRDIDQLALMAKRYQTLEEFLADLALEPPAKSVDQILASDNDNKERLVLSTIHSAKGLEWHTVFILHNIEGRFPSLFSLENPDSLEEERRLLYVAMTRAQENLFLTYPVSIWDAASQELLSIPSRFLGEIPPELVERWELVQN